MRAVVLALCAVSVLLLTAARLSAATLTWTGAEDTNWSNPNNWEGATIPLDGDALLFPSSAIRYSSSNDLSGLDLASITVDGTYTLSGLQITLSTGIAGSGVLTLDLPVQLIASQTWTIRGPINGAIDLQTHDLTIQPANTNLTVNASISGSGGVTYAGGLYFDKSLTIAGNMSYTGPTSTGVYYRTTLNITGDHSSTAWNVGMADDSFVTATGQLGPLTVSYARLSPALGNAGIIRSGNLRMSGRYVAQIGGATPGTGHDQLLVTGSADVSGGALEVTLTNGFVPLVGQELVIIDNDGTDAVLGPFINYPEGHQFVIGGQQFHLTYQGGTGNDVVIKRIDLARTWTGSVDDKWSEAGNWSGNVVPSAGSVLIFPPSAANTTNVNDLTADLQIDSMVVDGSYTLSGNRILLANGISGSGTLAMNLPVQLTATQGWTIRGPVNGEIDLQTHNLTVDPANTNLTVNASISGSGGVTYAGGLYFDKSLTIAGNMSYTGPTSTGVYYRTTLNITGDHSSTAWNVGMADDSFVTATGQLGPLTVSYARLSPALGNAGIIRSGNLRMSGRYVAQIGGATPGTGHDQLLVTGSADVSGGALEVTLTNGFVPLVGQEIVIIQNDGVDGIVGTFSGRPNGVTVQLGGYPYQLSYFGGDGNDVSLTRTSGFTLDPPTLRVDVGGSASIEARLQGLASSDILVVLASSDPSIVSVPANMTIRAGQISERFEVTGLASGGPVVVTATLPPELRSESATSEVTVGSIAFALNPQVLVLQRGTSRSMVVEIESQQSTNTVITLEGSSNAVIMPSAVTVPAGATFTSFELTGSSPERNVIVIAKLPEGLGGGTASASISVVDLTLDPGELSVAVGESSSLTVRLFPPPSAAVVASVESQQPQVVAAPASVSIPAGTGIATIPVQGLRAGSTIVLTVTVPSSEALLQRSSLVRVDRGAEIVAAILPPAIIQTASDGSTAQSQYTLRNLGDRPSDITLLSEGTADGLAFFSQSPTTFRLDAGQSETVTVISFPQEVPSSLNGFSVPTGTGVAPGLRVPVKVLSLAPPGLGIPDVVARENRVDVSGPSDANPEGDVVFENIGTAEAVGVLYSDVPWILSSDDTVRIAPGASASVHFVIDRSLRPDVGNLSGTASGVLYLAYAAGSTGTSRAGQSDPGALATPVNINDTVRPDLSETGIPFLKDGEISLVLAGVGHLLGGGGRQFVSDLTLTSSDSAILLSAVQLYFLPTGGSAIKANQTVSPNQPLLASDLVATLFGKTAQGSLHIRSEHASSLLASANVFNKSDPRGTFGTALPVLQSDRAVDPGGRLHIAGLMKDQVTRTNLYLQEMAGQPAVASIDFVDAAGALVSRITGIQVPPFGLFGMFDTVPAGAVTAIIVNESSEEARLAAFATPLDDASGDTWATADWNLVYDSDGSESKVIPAVGAASGANQTEFRTDLTLLNVGNGDGSIDLTYRSRDGRTYGETIQIGAGGSHVSENVVREMFGVNEDSVGSLFLQPSPGSSFLATSRTYTATPGSSGRYGTGVPAVSFSSALREPGASRSFSGLTDTRASTVLARRGSTYRTNLGLVEIGGKPVTVRMSIYFALPTELSGGAPKGTREITLQPYQFLQLNGIGREILGDSRDATYGDLFNVRLEVEVVGGEGAVLPFVTATDNGTNDTVLRLE